MGARVKETGLPLLYVHGLCGQDEIVFDGAEVQALSPNALVRRGCIQVMEGRHCFQHLTVEENLLTGAFTQNGPRAELKRNLDLVYSYFPRLKVRRTSQAGYTSGGEQQMCAVGRALMSRPKMILLDEPSMGLAPQVVEEVFEIVRVESRKDLAIHPRNPRSLYGLTRSLEAQKKDADAAAAKKSFEDAWRRADVHLASSAY